MTFALSVPRQPNGRKRKLGQTVAQIRGNGQLLDPDTIAILKRVAKLMSKKAMVPAELARCSGIGDRIYQILDPVRYARGSLRIVDIRAIATGLGVSVHELVDP